MRSKGSSASKLLESVFTKMISSVKMCNSTNIRSKPLRSRAMGLYLEEGRKLK
jgi:hypothetical protein